ncbi:hypothetical protein [Novilysobacter defluvii]|uniref:hypothetical protein n=1 Tax=Novilysobacter defluvii TaxID=391738 RepID=UPI0012B5EB2C|nr:hypothetical protein [Lysobacter defluvii]
MLRKLLGVFTAGAAAASPATAHHVFGNSVFSLDAPAIFTRNAKSEAFQLVAPNDLAAITATAYAKTDGSLDEFCEYRFSTIENFYKPVSEPQALEAAHASGKLQEFEGTWPGASSPTYYVVSCLQTGDVYVSLNIVTTRQHYSAYRAQYGAMLGSIRPGP